MNEKKFNVIRNDAEEVIGIEFNADAFIIPNHACKFEDFWLECVADAARKVSASLLGKEPQDDELCVEMWYVVDDLNCENLVDHGATVEIDGEVYDIDIPTRYLPYLALKDKREGDKLRIPFWDAAGTKDGNNIDVYVNVIFKQKEYRYRHFGSFEETLLQVIY